MQALVMLCVSLYIVAGIGVGVRLLRIAARTQGLPEAALGFTLFCFAAISQPPAILAEVAKQQGNFDASGIAVVISWVGTFLALVGLAVFTWRAFRPGQRWAAALALGCIGVDAFAIGGVIQNLRAGQLDAASLAPHIALSCVAFAVIFGWGAIEGFFAWSAARKRERLGLADGSVTNRFWLWSVSSLGGFLADVALIPLVLSGTDLTKDSSPQLVVALSALLNAACWFLAFAPPPAYSRWLEARQARA